MSKTNLDLTQDMKTILKISKKYYESFPAFSNALLNIVDLFLTTIEGNGKSNSNDNSKQSISIPFQTKKAEIDTMHVNNKQSDIQQSDIPKEVKDEVDKIVDDILAEDIE